MGKTVVTAHQANYLPYLGFFEKILVADRYVLVDDTQFVKRGPFGWIHRNRILGSSGPQWLTVPVKTHGRYDQNIADAVIDSQRNWSRKHLRAFELSYRKSPHFETIYPVLEAIYAREWTHLVDLSQALIEQVLQWLEIHRPITRSSAYGIEGQGSAYVLELAQKSGATHYLSGVHGKDYLDLPAFDSAGMGLIFQNFTCHPYLQLGQKSFVSHLSTFDALFNVGPKGTLQLLKEGGTINCP